MTDLGALRTRTVQRHIAARGIDDRLLLEAFRRVPREAFVPAGLAAHAYADGPLPIGFGQTISQPYIVALTVSAAAIKPGDKVLEIGAGSGYAAAIIGQIAAEVISIERHPELARLAALRVAKLGYDNVRVVEGDGTLGCPAESPFDSIVAAASGSHVPQILIEQLKIGGRIVMPLGEPGAIQQLVKVTKLIDGRLDEERLGAVRFVPLIGEHGFGET